MLPLFRCAMVCVGLAGCTCDGKNHPYFTIEANVPIQQQLLLAQEAPYGGSLRHLFLFGPVATAIEAAQHNFLAAPIVLGRMHKVWKGGDWCFKVVCVVPPTPPLFLFHCWPMCTEESSLRPACVCLPVRPPRHNLAANLLSDKYERNISGYGEAFCLMTPRDHRMLLCHVSQPLQFTNSPLFVFIFERVFDFLLVLLIFLTIFDTSHFILDIQAFIDCGIPFDHGDEMSRCLTGLKKEVINVTSDYASETEFLFGHCVDASEWYMVRSLLSKQPLGFHAH